MMLFFFLRPPRWNYILCHLGCVIKEIVVGDTVFLLSI
jgi:hypothetical protein